MVGCTGELRREGNREAPMTRRMSTAGATALVLALAACGGGSGSVAKTAAPGTTISPYSLAPTLAGSSSSGALPKGVLASVALGGGPLRLGAGFGSLWVATHRDSFLYRIDPRTNRVVAKIDTGNESCGTPVAGAGRIWVTGCDPGPTTVIDPATNQVVGSIKGEAGLVLAFSGGKVWLPQPYDARTLKAAGHVRAEGGDVVAAAGSIWVANSDDATVARVDPGTGRTVHTYHAGEVNSLESYEWFYDGAVWIASSAHVWRIDPRTNAVTTHTVDLGEEMPDAPLIAAGSLWIRTLNADILRFDLRTFRLVGHYPFSPGSTGFETVAFGSLWETNLENSTMWRDRI
jgi:DNA-binding beta-propeller fold protein YncE